MLASVLAGCATAAAVVQGDAVEAQAPLQARRTTRSTSGSRTQTVGLPLSRGGKIGLWTGVAVFVAYLMASDGEDSDADPVDP
jgi:hypothetical protein